MNTITVTFINGRKIQYTMAIFNLLVTDNEVLEIMDSTTGEILYTR